MPARDLALLTEVIAEAGRIAMRFFGASPKVWDKGGEHGPVTEADLAVNAYLKEKLRTARPDYGWLSEETPDDAERLTKQRLFIVDPIDGTRAFIAGETNFAISVAVAEAGEVIAGAVLLPAKNRLYTGEKGGSATRDGAAIRASQRAHLAGAHVLATKANMAPDYWPGGVPDLQRSFRTSLAYRLCLAAEGRYDGMLTFRPTWEWDIAAGALICACAGARVSDRFGAALRFNSPAAQTAGVVSTAPGIHTELMQRLGR